jgi:hypothetical protein
MHWTRIITVAGLVIATPAAAAAQDTIKPTPPPPTQQQPQYQDNQMRQADWYGERNKALMKGITLNSQQQAKVDSIHTKYKDQLPPLPADQPGQPQQMPQHPDSATNALLMIILERQDNEVRAALNPEQQRVWDKNKMDWKKNQSQRTPVGS